jgi:two-component system sensor histidine kinase PrrB
VRRPGSLRVRITLAAVLALVLAGTASGAVLLAEIEQDGRQDVDRQLRQRAAQVGRPGYDRGGYEHPGGNERDQRLLAGSGSFLQLAYGDRVVERRGDVPASPTGVPGDAGLRTLEIGGDSWRSLTVVLNPGHDLRLQLLSSLEPVDARVAHVRDLVLLIGLGALALIAVAAWGFTTLAVRPLARLRTGAARVSGAEDLGTPLPEDEGPVEVRSLARALNEMLERLGASTESMERALAATRRFAADAGHELRTPLTGLRANLDTLARNPGLPLEERQALLEETTAEQERIVHLLEGLQALARGEATETLPREHVELADTALYAARRRHPAVRYELDEGIGDAAVWGWGGGLRLLVDNLLDNAALHGRRDGRVRVGLARDDGSLVARVDDDGPGIPPDQHARLLEPFTRGAETEAPGTGLGLAIVAQQVALHGGELRLHESTLGGLAVEVRLPALA